mmetsp:Transcript_57814/g.183336  ORF Transcript_57814/g.183336 Transcript_57814/m.183336 type:complete len:251 (+) Transcript_57814:1968-2720(+)
MSRRGRPKPAHARCTPPAAAADGAHLEGGVAAVHEGDIHRLVLGELVRLVDAIAQGGGGGLVHEAETVEAGDGGRIEHGAALPLSEEDGARDDTVLHVRPLIRLGNRLEVGEHHGQHALRREVLLLVQVGHADEALAVLAFLHLVRQHGEVLLHICAGELLADEALDLNNGVLRVHGLRGRAVGAQEALLGAEGHHGRRLALGLLVEHDIDALPPRESDGGGVVTDIEADHGHSGGGVRGGCGVRRAETR